MCPGHTFCVRHNVSCVAKLGNIVATHAFEVCVGHSVSKFSQGFTQQHSAGVEFRFSVVFSTHEPNKGRLSTVLLDGSSVISVCSVYAESTH